jgi:hypothetical protein
MKKMFGFDVDDVLHYAGLERRATLLDSLLPALSLLFVGAAIGAGVGLVFAPSSGRSLRQGVSDRIDRFRVRRTKGQPQVAAVNATPHS